MVLKYLTAWTILSPSPLSSNIPRASLALQYKYYISRSSLMTQLSVPGSPPCPLTALARWCVMPRRCGFGAA